MIIEALSKCRIFYLRVFIWTGSKLDRDRDTTSQDSGISQMSDNLKEAVILEEKMEELTLRPNFNLRSGPRSLPYSSVNGVTETDSNGFRSLGKWKIHKNNLFTNCLRK